MSIAAKQTPWTAGPWQVLEKLSGSQNHKGFNILVVSDRTWIGEISPRDWDGVEGKANADLIALAPEMAEALNHLMNTAGSADSLAEGRALLDRLPKAAA